MTAPEPPRAPRVPADLTRHEPDELADDAQWSQVDLTGDFSGQTVEDLDVAESRLASVSFTGVEFERLRATNTVFEGCDLSGATLYDAVLQHVAFSDCRMSGVVLAGATLRDVVFSRCKLDGANFRLSKGERVLLEEGVLPGADFYGAAWVSAAFLDSDLTGAQFAKVDLRGAHFHGSTIDDIRGAEHLKGIVIDSAQIVPFALPLFAGLGIVIDDDTDH